MTNNNTLTRRRILKGSATAATIGLAGCVGSGGNSSGNNSPNSIDYWNIHSGDGYEKPINQIVNKINRQKDIKATVRFINNDSLAEELSSAIASDTLPAVAFLALQSIYRLGSDGSLSTNTATSVIKSIGEDDFREGILKFMTTPKSGYYAVPTDAWIQGIWYRKSAFEQQGLKPPKTWDAVRKAANTFSSQDGIKAGLAFGTKKDIYARQCFTAIARSNGGLVLDKNNTVVFDEKSMIEALQYIKDISEYVPGAITASDALNLYESKQCHMFFYSSYLLPNLVEDMGKSMVKDTTLAPSLQNTRKSTYGQVLGHSIFSGSQTEREASKTLIKSIMSGESYVKWCHMFPGGTLPVLKSTANSKAYLNNKTISNWGKTIEKMSNSLSSMERFDIVNGNYLPKFADIGSQLLVAEAVNRVTVQGDNPRKVAKEQAKKMRSITS